MQRLLSCSRRKCVTVVNISGVISLNKSSSLNFTKVNTQLSKAFKTPNCSAVAVCINSPGGSPVQSELIYNRIRTLSKNYEIPVLVFVEDIAASGGYYIACAGDEIYASVSSIVGSIGVISAGFGFHSLLANHGIERRVYAQGENKNILDPFMPVKESDIEILNSVGKDIHKAFIDIVKERRGALLKNTDEELFTGKFWSGKHAKELGLIDDTGCLYDTLYKKYGDDVEIKFIKEDHGFIGTIKGLIGIGVEAHANSLVESMSVKIESQLLSSRFGI